MVYSPRLMEDREKQQEDLGGLEEKVGELEKLTDSLDEVPEDRQQHGRYRHDDDLLIREGDRIALSALE